MKNFKSILSQINFLISGSENTQHYFEIEISIYDHRH